jgi:nucleoside phosphorylase/tetratricopeptide (TPR) repeat protein
MTKPTFDQADFVIITALDKEAKAVVLRLENHTIEQCEAKDIRTYHCGTVPVKGGGRGYCVAVVLLPSMGELSAANAVTDAIVRWNPQYVLMVGIAAGVPQDDLDLGDVAIGDQVVGYEYGKVTGVDIEPRDRVYQASSLLLERVRNFWDESWMGEVHAQRPKNAKRERPKVFVGPIASGNKVIASVQFREGLTARWAKLIGVEMEAEGVFSAVLDRPQLRGTMVIRGISDMGDERKSDEWQDYAADVAAAFVIGFLRSGPVDTRQTAPETAALVNVVKISTAKLPSTSRDLFGREKELAMLDEAWGNPKINVVSLVAWGGVGKTALVRKWLLQMQQDGYRGAERVFGWSFYSQGAAEGKQVSADQFIAAALKWFGDPKMADSSSSSWEKGERLTELVKQERTLLILDGLEPLQNPPPNGGIRDRTSGLVALLRELAQQNPGLAIVTTRLPVDDLTDFVGTSVQQTDLEDLSPKAGAAYLNHLGVEGTAAEREEAAQEYKGHALALTLLGCYLVDVYEGDVRKRDLIPRLMDEEEKGAHARKMMEAYQKWFEGKPEQNIVHMLGLFDRPAQKGAIQSLLARPRIAGLTDEVHGIKAHKWLLAVKHLRSARLLAERGAEDPDTLDCHPLIREYFGEKLKENNLKAWREAHRRLYEYYKCVPKKELPDTIEEMAPLFAAVMHGCQAGRYQQAWDEVYRERIHRGNRYFSVRQLGAFGSVLATLSGFFAFPWQIVVAGVREDVKGNILNTAGSCLRALGRLAESAGPMRAALEVHASLKDWRGAAASAANFSEVCLITGDIAQALNYARQSIELGDLSGDAFMKVYSRTDFAAALHQTGRLPEAEAAFGEAERIQREWQPDFPQLYSYQGFRYWDFVLEKGEFADVQHRVVQALEWMKREGSLLDSALGHLCLGRADLLQTQVEDTSDFTQATSNLESAVVSLRKSGVRDELPRGLLARAELRRVTGAQDKARLDLDEAFSIAARGGMRLHEADCHLGYARWYLASGDKPKAWESLDKARKMIEDMGYHRRDKEVKELEAQLGDE